MDNITHTLVGVLIGETVARFIPGRPSGLADQDRRNLFVAVGAVGSNVPDLDFLSSFIAQNKLHYLSQHRGYTHTVIGVLVGAALVMLLTEIWLKWRHVRPTPRDRKTLAFLVTLALALHVSMDYTNSYGVHPFWPIYNGWFYGDAIFIIEPSLWVAAAPLLFMVRTRVARVVIGLILLATLALGFGSGWILLPNAIVLAVLLFILLSVGWKASPKAALLSALSVWVAITAVFLYASHLARERVVASSVQRFPQEQLLDQVLTPMPANPLCWDVIAALSNGDQYGLRRGILSLAPRWLSPAECGDKSLANQTTAQLVPIADTDSTSLEWHDEWHMSKQRFMELVRSDCEATILMHFARAPFARFDEHWIVGDLRYDREPGLGFAEVELSLQPRPCVNEPPWLPPRSDLLDGK